MCSSAQTEYKPPSSPTLSYSLPSPHKILRHTHSACLCVPSSLRHYINHSMHAHLLQMLSHSNFLSLHHSANSNTSPLRAFPRFLVSRRDFPPIFGSIGLNSSQMSSFHEVSVDSSVCRIHGYGVQSAGIEFDSFDLDRFAEVGNQLADAAGDVIRKYFRKSFDILDKEDLSRCFLLSFDQTKFMWFVLSK